MMLGVGVKRVSKSVFEINGTLCVGARFSDMYTQCVHVFSPIYYCYILEECIEKSAAAQVKNVCILGCTK